MRGGRFASTDEVFNYLMRFVNVEKGQATEFKLDRMAAMAADLGDPQRGRLTIHVAGSKGKGSVSTMVARILGVAGLKAGLYTSPHLIRWKERITLAGDEIDESVILGAMDELMPWIEGRWARDYLGPEAPTYFELTTLVAFCAFRSLGCDAQVIETGLGGRLDSTNIVDSDLSVITPIELEHTQFLGDTIPKIAYEKAGIIKPGKPVCVAVQKPEADAVFALRAAESGSALHRVADLVRFTDARIARNGTTVVLRAMPGAPTGLSGILGGGVEVRCPMPGAVQAQNMALAALAVAVLRDRIAAACGSGGGGGGGSDGVSEGSSPGADELRQGLALSRLPARFEFIPGAGNNMPDCILDGAHTPESVRLALDTFRTLCPGPAVLLFACAADKKHQAMAAILGPHFDATVVTRPGTFKESEPDAVFESFRGLARNAELEPDTARALTRALEIAAARGATLLVTGSFYLCAEARAWLESRGRGS